MPRSLTKLLSIAPGEERKTALLYSLHLIFYLGLMWGDAARESLFLSAWSADDLAQVFVIYAGLGLAIGAVYAFVADRISNGKLLKIIMGVMVLWLISVRIMLYTNGGPRGLVYPYFYLAYTAFRDLSTMHILTYINDFYDTRAAKRALPLMLSAGIAGGTLAGFTTSLLNSWFGLENTPQVWIVCLVLSYILMLVIERQLRGDLEQIERRRIQARSANKQTSQTGLQNLREGFDNVRKPGLLRILAISTLAMVVLMKLLVYQSSHVFAAEYANNPGGLFEFYGILGGITNVSGLLIQSVLLSRLINWLGVGTMNLAFPIMTLGSVAAINFAPGMASAVFARLDQGMFKQAFRNPLDTMLYNSIPVTAKARARGFVNGVIVPAGTLFAGLLIMGAKAKILTGPVLIGMGIGIAVLYVLGMFLVRREYARSMTSLLASDEISLFSQDTSDVLPPDPATLKWLRQRLETLPTDFSADGQAVLISQVLFDIDERTSLPLILDLVAKRGSFFRKGVIEFLDEANVESSEFVRLCRDSLDDSESVVRASAATALLNYLKRSGETRSAVVPRDASLNDLFIRLDDLQLEEQAHLVVMLLRSGSPAQKSVVLKLLETWLTSAELDQDAGQTLEPAPVLEAGLIALAETERQGLLAALNSFDPVDLQKKRDTQPSRFKNLVGSMLKHPDPYVRQQVISALVRECRQAHWEAGHWAMQSLERLLDDPEESIRLKMIEELQDDAELIPLKPVLWRALNDPGLSVRKAVCRLSIQLHRAEIRALWECLNGDALTSAPNRAESAIYLLIKANQPGVNSALSRAVDQMVRDAYWLALQGIALKELIEADSRPRPGANIMESAFQENALIVLEQVFWLLSASSSEEEIQAVQRALSSEDSTERANAAEALEANLSPATARQLLRLLDGSPSEKVVSHAEQDLGMHKPNLTQMVKSAWSQLELENTILAIPESLRLFYKDGWLTAIAIFLLAETHTLPGQDSLDVAIPHQTVQKALVRTLEVDTRPNVKEAATLALKLMDTSSKENLMSAEQPLTLIEKVIFLREVPFFSELPLQEIFVLAGISEEVSYPAEYKIFKEGDTTKTLYLIIKGRVSVQQQTRSDTVVRLAQLREKSYFAETSLFDGAPHQADIVTIDPVDLLLIRQSALFMLIRRRPDIGLSLLKSLSQRLRETYAQVAQSERAKSQKLVSLFDKLEG